MKAIIQNTYGSPDVLRLEKKAKPVPKDNEVLVRVQAASLNPYDWHLLRAKPFLVRFYAGLLRPNMTIPGKDFAGIIKTVGKNVTQFKPGNEVFGISTSGSLAEYTVAAETQVCLKSAQLTHAMAASLPMAGICALQGLRDTGQLKSGQTVLINGSSGGIGTLAVQLASLWGAEVTAVCSTNNRELVHSLGAAYVLDYTRQDITRTGNTYDLVFDTVGNLSIPDYERLTKPGGICVVVGFTSMAQLWQVITMKSFSNRTIRLFSPKMNQKDFALLEQYVASGKIKPVTDRTYSLCETAKAIRYLEQGHARGKVIIEMPVAIEGTFKKN